MVDRFSVDTHTTLMAAIVLRHLLVYPLFVSMISGDICTNDTYRCHCNCTNPGNCTQVECKTFAFNAFPTELPSTVQRLTINNGNIQSIWQINQTSLETLDLQMDNIFAIADMAFNGLSVVALKLQHNNISRVTNETFMGLSFLKYLYLSYNPIYELQSGVFSSQILPRLEEVFLVGCRISKIFPGAFTNQNRFLQYIDLSQNKLQYSDQFQRDKLSSLLKLNLSYNSISTLGGFQLMESLGTLDLQGNTITSVKRDAFHGLENKLNELNLSWNNISCVAGTSFIILRSLAILDLSHNSLSSLLWEELPWQTLTTISIADNPWNCSCVNAWLIQTKSNGLTNQVPRYNDNNYTRCGSPPSLQGKALFSLPRVSFQCPTHHSQSGSSKVLVVVSVILSVTAVCTSVAMAYSCYTNRSRGRGKYVRFSVTEGLHM